MVASGILWLVILLALVVALLLMPLLAMIRMAWRVFRDNEQLEPGGSMGRQLFRRNR